LDAALYPLGEEIKSGRVHRLIDFVRRGYRYCRQKFVLTLDRPACDALARGSINESHRLSCRKIARRRPAKTAGSPRRLPQRDLWPLDVECKKGALHVFRRTR